jgi:hypothetical protein
VQPALTDAFHRLLLVSREGARRADFEEWITACYTGFPKGRLLRLSPISTTPDQSTTGLAFLFGWFGDKINVNDAKQNVLLE